jgi:hypothetical protein
MSKNLERVIQRAISDAGFRRQLQSNPEAALRGFKLTDTEVAALRSGDAGKLTSLGIDQRMSKTFTFGGDSLASRSSVGGDLTTGSGSSALDPESASGATRLVIPGAGGNTSAFDPGVAGDTTSVGDPLSDSGTASVIADPDNPGHARGYIGGQAASTSDAMEDQSHSFAATRSADVSASAQAAPIEGTPEEFAFRDQGATASSLADPDNPANARGYIGEQMSPTADAIEDQSHAIAASRSDAFLSEGEASQYSADTDLSTGMATDEGQLTSNAADTIPDDAGTVSVRHEPDIPS